MPPQTPRRRRARPVADAPIDQLLTRPEDLAKGWLLALLEEAPLEDAPAILAADLAREGPRLCDAVLRAITDEADLRRLQRGGALTVLAARAGELAAASAPVAVSRAVDALRAVIWAGLRAELRSPDAELVSELSERLTLVCELLREASLGRAGSPRDGDRAGHGAPPDAGETPPDAGEAAAASAPPSAAGAEPDVTEDVAGLRVTGFRRHDADTPVPDGLWVRALDDAILDAQSAGVPLALLLVELEDSDRLVAVEAGPGAQAMFGGFARAVRAAVRRQEILVREADGRVWIIAPGTPRAGARVLAARISAAVADAQSWRGVPMTASVGIAIAGEDGKTSGDLIEAAEEARYAAAAAGVTVAPVTRDLEAAELGGAESEPEPGAGR
jgi:GGDEF domain-containing protein